MKNFFILVYIIGIIISFFIWLVEEREAGSDAIVAVDADDVYSGENILSYFLLSFVWPIVFFIVLCDSFFRRVLKPFVVLIVELILVIKNK